MKKVPAILMALVVGMAAARLLHQRPASAEWMEPVSTCADVNSDAAADISDAVYLLNWLFGGGPAPKCPPCESPPPGCALPDTGQTLCYDEDGNEIPCDSATCPGQDGLYAKGSPLENRFVDNHDGTVTDTRTGLMWQQNTADVSGDQRIDGNDELPWCDALAYCEDLVFAGHDDWRLPNVRELQSIVDYGRWNPAIDPVFHALSSWYWSSTSRAVDPDVAWRVVFFVGTVNVGSEGGAHHVRAVRTAP